MPVLITSTAPNSASCGGADHQDHGEQCAQDRVEPGQHVGPEDLEQAAARYRGSLVDQPASVLARTASSVSPVTATSGGMVMAGWGRVPGAPPCAPAPRSESPP